MSSLGTAIKWSNLVLIIAILCGCQPSSIAPTSTNLPSFASPTPKPTYTPIAIPTDKPKFVLSPPELTLPTVYPGPLPDGAEKVLGVGNIYSSAVSHDGSRIAILSDMGLSLFQIDSLELVVWNVSVTGHRAEHIQWLPDDSGILKGDNFYAYRFDPDSLAEQASLKLVDAYEGKDISPYFDGWNRAVPSPDGSMVAFVSEYGIVIWNMLSGSTVRLDTDVQVEPDTLRWARDSNRLGFGPPVTVWNRNTNSTHIELFVGSPTQWSPDLDRLIVHISYNLYRLWGVTESWDIRDFESAPEVSPDWSLLAVIIDGRIQIHDASTGLELKKLGANVPDNATLVWSPDSSMLAVGNAESVTLWNIYTTNEHSTLKGMKIGDFEDESVNYIFLDWSVDNKWLFSTVPGDMGMSIWNVDTGAREASELGLFGAYLSLPNDRAILGGDNRISLVNTQTGKVLNNIEGSNASKNFAWSSDGSQLAVISDDIFPSQRTTTVWDVVTGNAIKREQRQVVADFDYATSSAASFSEVSPDGSRKVDSNLDKVVIMDAATNGILGETMINLPKDGPTFPAYAWSPDSHYLGGVILGTYYLWDAQSGNLIGKIRLRPGYMDTLAFSPNSKFMAIRTFGAIIIYSVP